MKIEELIESIKDWPENPYVKMHEMFELFSFTSDKNIKLELCEEILEEINEVLKEFPKNSIQYIRLIQIKNNCDLFLTLDKRINK